MQPAFDPTIDYKALVRQGYDRCFETYHEARRSGSDSELAFITRPLPEGSHILDIGCGSGVPIAKSLSRRFQVTGVDLSGEQLRLARRYLPAGSFIHADIMTVDFPAATFDAVVAFYAIFHLPREEHAELFRRIRGWLKKDGYLLATVTTWAEAPYTEDDFFGVQMYWSNYGLDDYQKMLALSGFRLLEHARTGHGYDDVMEIPVEDHPLIFAQAI